MRYRNIDSLSKNLSTRDEVVTCDKCHVPMTEVVLDEEVELEETLREIVKQKDLFRENNIHADVEFIYNFNEPSLVDYFKSKVEIQKETPSWLGQIPVAAGFTYSFVYHDHIFRIGNCGDRWNVFFDEELVGDYCDVYEKGISCKKYVKNGWDVLLKQLQGEIMTEKDKVVKCLLEWERKKMKEETLRAKDDFGLRK